MFLQVSLLSIFATLRFKINPDLFAIPTGYLTASSSHIVLKSFYQCSYIPSHRSNVEYFCVIHFWDMTLFLSNTWVTYTFPHISTPFLNISTILSHTF